MTEHVLILEVKRPPMLANQQRRWHWSRVREAKRTAQTMVWAAAKQAKIPRQRQRVVVDITWFAPDNIHRDSDGLGPFAKAAIDGLVTAGVLDDDDHRFVARTSTAIEVDRGRPRIEIRVAETETP